MALSSRQITQMITAPPTGVSRGRAQFAVQQAKGVGSHEQFARDMAALPVQQRSRYVHPQDAIRTNTSKTTALTPSDLMWIDRLPRDPAAVPFDDAVQVAALHEGLVKNQPPGSSDRRLLEAVWRPISEHHDAKAADVGVTNAAQPLPPIPQSALQALIDAIRAEIPALTDAEVVNRASDALATALEERSVEHGMKAWGAQARADQVKSGGAS